VGRGIGGCPSETLEQHGCLASGEREGKMSIRSPNALCRAVLQPFRQILPRGGRMIERISSLPTARSPPAPALNPPQSRTLNTRALPPVPSPERSVPSSPPGPPSRSLPSPTRRTPPPPFFPLRSPFLAARPSTPTNELDGHEAASLSSLLLFYSGYRPQKALEPRVKCRPNRTLAL